MKLYLFGAILSVLSLSALASDVTSLAWSAEYEARLNADPAIKVQAERILSRLGENADLPPPSVGGAYFADLNGDRHLELVTTVDYSGRSFFNNVAVITKVGGQYSVRTLRNNGYSIASVRDQLVDIDRDGRPELVLQRFIRSYEGAKRVPLETVIYRWDKDGDFVDVSDSHVAYYRDEVVPKLERQLADASGPSTSKKSRADEVLVLEAELAEAKRQARLP
ncbi:MAG: VCBS repeat-containing protein [Methylocaldum sp.]|nr:VCBS repeat-containing protein [Methylocaldum sp.]